MLIFTPDVAVDVPGQDVHAVCFENALYVLFGQGLQTAIPIAEFGVCFQNVPGGHGEQ